MSTLQESFQEAFDRAKTILLDPAKNEWLHLSEEWIDENLVFYEGDADYRGIYFSFKDKSKGYRNVVKISGNEITDYYLYQDEGESETEPRYFIGDVYCQQVDPNTLAPIAEYKISSNTFVQKEMKYSEGNKLVQENFLCDYSAMPKEYQLLADVNNIEPRTVKGYSFKINGFKTLFLRPFDCVVAEDIDLISENEISLVHGGIDTQNDDTILDFYKTLAKSNEQDFFLTDTKTVALGGMAQSLISKLSSQAGKTAVVTVKDVSVLVGKPEATDFEIEFSENTRLILAAVSSEDTFFALLGNDAIAVKQGDFCSIKSKIGNIKIRRYSAKEIFLVLVVMYEDLNEEDV